MIDLFLVFGAGFLYVIGKSGQQLNVVHDKYLWVLPTSWWMAAAEVYIISWVASQGWSVAAVFAFGTGTGLGAMAGMYIHRRLRNGKDFTR